MVIALVKLQWLLDCMLQKRGFVLRPEGFTDRNSMFFFFLVGLWSLLVTTQVTDLQRLTDVLYFSGNTSK